MGKIYNYQSKYTDLFYKYLNGTITKKENKMLEKLEEWLINEEEWLCIKR